MRGLLFAAIVALSGTSGTTAPLEDASAQAPQEALLLQQPTVGGESLVFVHAGDLWIVHRDGGEARRLTSSPGIEDQPQLRHDGAQVAFTGQYEGNRDVYVMNTAGGRPTRLTWHPGDDSVLDWHPDGQRILFSSRRQSGPPVDAAYLVPASGGNPELLPIPKLHHAAYSPSGDRIAYTPIRDAFRTWRRYRGGRLTTVWLYDPDSRQVEVVPTDRANDTFPAWLDDGVYFASDRDGVMNLFRHEPGSAAVQQITHFTDFDIRSMDGNGSTLVLERAGALHLYEAGGDGVRRLSVHLRSDGLESGPRWKAVGGAIRGATLAPNGKRAAFAARGEIVTLPKKHGDPRFLSPSPGVHDRNPAWSPDGTQIAWFADVDGEYRLLVQDHLGRDEPRVMDLGGGGFYRNPRWSPDGERVLFHDKTGRIAFVNLSDTQVTEVAHVYGSLGEVDPGAAWSADSKWIAFENRNPYTLYDHLSLFELSTRKTTSLTDGFGQAGHPAFSPDGKMLYFTGSINSGPAKFGLDMGAAFYGSVRANLYVAVLQAEGEHPFGPRSDEATNDEDEGEDEGEDDQEDKKKKKKKKKKNNNNNNKKEEKEQEKMDDEVLPAIDLESLDQRIVALPLKSDHYWSLAATNDALYYVKNPDGEDPRIERFDLEKRESETVRAKVHHFDLAKDGKSIFAQVDGKWEIFGSGAGGGEAESLPIGSVKVRVDPAQEWPQILREVWRIQRDYFYDPGLHGTDWDAMWDRWSVFLPHVHHRADLDVLVASLIAELRCGHQYHWGGDRPSAPSGASVGLLGADVEIRDGRYRIRRILSGQNWNPNLRAPLTEPGVNVHPGDYILAVDGRPLSTSDNFYRAFENRAGRQVELELSSSKGGEEPRTVTVVPIANDSELQRKTWIETNRARVDSLSGGRLAYVYMPNTGGAGKAAFDRDFFSQVDHHGLILDERYNGGGKVADYVIEVLSRRVHSYWMSREGWVGRTPFGVLDGPMVMVTNEYAGSGGDWLPWAFQKSGLGPTVGTRTWGGLVGITGYPALMDGGSVTAASFGVMDSDGHWAVENVGVPPDHEVIEWPADILDGHDPQLDRAVALALEALEDRPPTSPPTYIPPDPR